MLDINIVLAYITVTNGPRTHEFAARFCGSWLANPPQANCEVVVCCNGGPIQRETGELFQALGVPVKFFPRANDPGFDVSAYLDVAAKFPCDFVCACGESIFFHRSGWLKRYEEEAQRHGPGIYGTFSSKLVSLHLNSTGVFVSPQFLLSTPRPRNRADRYSLEHGPEALWRKIVALGFVAKMVTFDGCYDPKDWRKPENILWKGTQDNLLMQCGHSERYAAADSATRIRWQQGADGIRTTV